MADGWKRSAGIMVTLPIYNLTGSKVGDYEIDPRLIAPKVTKQLLHEAVVMYLANERQGSNKTKSRGEVSGSTKKMYRQKGTGNARMGAKRTPVRRGGGHANSRQPRSYYYRLPRKAVQAATRMAIASKLESGSVVLLDRLGFEAPKTSVMAGALKALGLSGVTATLATAGVDSNAYLSGRNIPGLSVMPVADLNALAVLRPSRLVMTKDALDWLKARVAG
jgi:large subunit ribosomal protein L4